MKIHPKNNIPRVGYKFYCTVNQYIYIVEEVSKDNILFRFTDIDDLDGIWAHSEWPMDSFIRYIESREMLRK